LLLAGCTAGYHRQAADKEVYGLIRHAEGRVLKRTNEFNIDTRYSGRNPQGILPAELIADRLETNQWTLSVEQALALAIQNSREYQAQKEALYLASLALSREKYKYQPRLLASLGATATRNRDGSKDGEMHAGGGASVSQLLASGGTLGLSLANDFLRYYTGDPRRSAVSSLSVNLVQPLLQGFGRNNSAVESLTQAERNLAYAVRDYSHYQNQFALGIVNDYFQLLAQKDAVRNNYASYLSKVDSTKRLEERAQDREARNGVDQARQSELAAKNSYVNSVANYQTSLDQFKIKLGLPVGQKLLLADQELQELTANGLVPVALDGVEAFKLATQKHLPTLNEIDRFEDSKRRLRIAADRFKPNLTLVADAQLDSQGATDWTRFNADQVRASAGLELDLPLDRKPQRFNYREALIAFERELRSLTLTFDNLRSSIERGLRTLDQRRENFFIQRRALELARQRVESTTLLQQAGRAEVRDVLEAQDALIASQNALTTALVQYQQSRLQLMLDIGALLADKPKFWLQDHLAGFLPAARPQPAPVAVGDQPVLPPEQYFSQ